MGLIVFLLLAVGITLAGNKNDVGYLLIVFGVLGMVMGH